LVFILFEINLHVLIKNQIVLNAMFMNAITDISTAYYRSVRMNNSLRPLSSKLLLGGYIICAIVCIISLIGTLITNDHVWALQKYIGTAILIVVGGGHLLVSLLKLRSLLRHSNQLTLTKVDVKSANNHEVERTRYSSPNSRLESTAGAHIPQSPRVSTSPRCRPQSKPEQLQINSADNAKNERTTSSEVNERTALKASSSRESGMKLRQDNKSPSGIARQPSNWRSSSVASSTPGTPQNYQHRSHRESVPSPTHRRELQGMVSGEDNMTRKLYRMMIITTTTMCALVAFLIFDIYIQFKQENVPASETYNLHAEAYDPRSDARLYIFLLALSVLVYFATPASFTIARCYARRPPLPVVSPAFQGRKASLV